MKTNWSLCLQWLFAAFLMAAFTTLNAQTFSTSVNSSNGYTVHVELTPVAVNATTPCQWGFNYTVDIAYNIWFTGNNVPNSLWVLQAEIKCEDDFFFDLPNTGGSGVLTTGQQWHNQSNCATASPISMECFEIELEIQGPSLSRRFIDQDLEYTPVAQAMHNGGSFCRADITQLPYETYGDDFNSGNIFTAQLSDANGSFANPINIGTRSDRDGGTINVALPLDPPPGNGYRMRVISSNPETIGPDNGANIAITGFDIEPTAWGQNQWIAHCFNVASFVSNPNQFVYSNYRGYYTSNSLNINSTNQ